MSIVSNAGTFPSNSVESYKHRYAKKVLADWFRECAIEGGGCGEYGSLGEFYWRANRGAPLYGIFEEYPLNSLIVSSGGYVNAWDEHWVDDEGCGSVPTYDQLVAAGNPPIAILDVAIQHKGCIKYGFEVVHTNGISPSKAAYLACIDVEIYTIDAEWILRQVARPKELKLIARYGAGF